MIMQSVGLFHGPHASWFFQLGLGRALLLMSWGIVRSKKGMLIRITTAIINQHMAALTSSR